MRTVHKVCTMIRRHDASTRDALPMPCRECPAVEKLGSGHRGMRACRYQAQSFINIVKTGNPWGKARCKWPTPRK